MHPLITDQHATPNPENVIVVIGVTGDFSLVYWIIWDEHIQWSAYLEGKWEFLTSPQALLASCTTCHTHLEMHPWIIDQHATPNPENVIVVIGVTDDFSLVYWIIWDEHIQWSGYLEGKWEFLTSPQGVVVNTADGGCWELNLRELDLHIDGVVPQCEGLRILVEKRPN
ncbi:hypothetical protein L1887_27791 [Cichorium endivia]|nr:hypothetical protein L1887_27791 [Cichorium endivia]